MSKDKQIDLLVEVGVEEMPAGSIAAACDKMRHTSSILLTKALSVAVPDDKLLIFATPRRLVITLRDVGTLIEGVSTRKEAIEKLSEALPSIIKSVRFPKTMRWDDSSIRFARPIRWVLALLGSDVIDFDLGAIKSGGYTHPPLLLSGKAIRIKDASQYRKFLKRFGIILDHNQRRAFLADKMKRIATRLKAKVDFDEALLNEVTFLVEMPWVFFGEFGKEYLDLPPEVLVASMSKNQRIFPLRRTDGSMMNYFIGVTNNKKGKESTIKKNYETVLDAKLKDALFFFKEDVKEGMEAKIDTLKHLVLHKDLGSMYDKTERLIALSGRLADLLGVSKADKDNLTRAAKVCKIDLVTNMVGEFPSLQGVMGARYASHFNENRDVSTAIEEHYLPRASGDAIPKSMAGAMLALADKMDALVGFFGIKQFPSGSYDPYALRRAAYGVIRILRGREISVSLEDLIGASFAAYTSLKLDLPELKKRLGVFLTERLKEDMGQLDTHDIVEAVLSIDASDVFNAFQRLEAISALKKDAGDLFEAARLVNERTYNIIKKDLKVLDGLKVNEDLFIEDPEKDLWAAFKDGSSRIREAVDKKDYKKATTLYGKTFRDPVHRFFDEVMVNVEEEKLRLNRMAMMQEIFRLYSEGVADLSRVVVKKGRNQEG